MLRDILEKYNKNKIFIETGTWHGDGVVKAVKTNMFDQIHSIEIEENLFKNCLNRFKQTQNVNLHLGDSGIVLKDIIKDIDQGITFWLDGHWSLGDTGCADNYLCPIQYELEIIKNDPNREKHIIIIDDMGDFTEENISWNKNQYPDKEVGYMTKKMLEEKLREINNNLNIIYVGNICVATPYN